MEIQARSDFLFARPSFSEGVGRVLDMGGTLTEFNVSPDGVEADRWALDMDWRVTGDDLRRAIKEIREQHPELANVAATE